MNIRKRICSFSLMIVFLGAFTTGCSSTEENKVAANQLVEEERGLTAQGVIEAKEISINTKIPGKIIKVHIEEGQEVKAGDLLLEISNDEIMAKKEQTLALISAAESARDAATGQVAAAKAMFAKANKGARSQDVEKAKAYFELMQKTFQRVDSLYEKGGVSKQKRDEVETQLKVAKATLSMANEGARSEDISAAQALVTQATSMEQAANNKVDQAKAGLQEVEAYLKDTKILAPIDGTITVLNSDEGELVSTGMGIATVSNLEDTWVEVKVKETDLGKVSVGQIVDVKLLSYEDEKFEGKVVRINKKPDFATKRATSENGDFDVVAFGVKIEINDNGKVLRPGMTAIINFSE